MNYIDIPARQVLAEIQDKIIKQISEALQVSGDARRVEKLDWTEDGLRIWLKTSDEENTDSEE